jgi:hypothetical protein
MTLKHFISVLITVIVLSNQLKLYSLDSLVRNDPYPLFSSVYPYSFLATRQKAYLQRFEYAYPIDKFYISISGFRQSANRARDPERNVIQIGDINGRWNVLGLFYDPPLRDKLFQALGLTAAFNCANGIIPQEPNNPCPCDPDLVFTNTCRCFDLITDPNKSDPNQEFGFFSVPIDYRKYGVRVESELLLIDRCFWALGLQLQFGIVDVRQTILLFNDLTCQALGIACPGYDSGTESIAAPATPAPVTPPGITPPFLAAVPPCPALPTNECAVLPQTFTPCSNTTCCFSYSCDCKRLVIERIMRERETIAEILGLDINNYHKIGVEDVRLNLFWRHIFVINEESDLYPRLLFMPFATLGVGLPMERAQPMHKLYSVPIGHNNNHVSVGATGGFTLDFLDTIDLNFSGGITHFFRHTYCNYRLLPTNMYESGVFPYTADVTIEPGLTWHMTAGMHAYHFLSNLSVWAEYVIVSHAQDEIKICRSFIPSTSNYFKHGFLVERAEEFYTKWEAHVINIGFNYDLSPHLTVGVLWQAPVKQRNVYRSTTIMGTLTFYY